MSASPRRKTSERGTGAEDASHIATAVEAGLVALVAVDRDGRITFANAPAERIFHLTRDEATARTYNAPTWRITDLDGGPFPDADLPFARVRATGEPVHDVEHAIEWPDGQRVLLSIDGAPLFDTEGHFDGMVATIRDVTERGRNEAALRKSEERFRLFFERTPDYAYLVSPDRRLIDVNPAALTTLGYARHELVGRPLETIYAPDALVRMAELFEQWKETGQLTNEEMTIITKSGERRVVLLSAAMVRDDAGRPMHSLSVQRDITDRRRLEDQLLLSQKMEAIGQLAGGVAHDFNNLLTAIRGYAELARDGMDPDEPRRADLDEVIANADRAADLVRQLLAFGRRQVLEPRVVDPAVVANDLAAMLRRLLGEHIELTMRAAPGLGHVKVDQSQLEQVVVNLTVNAADAMPDGGVLTVELSNVEIDPTYAAAHAEVAPGPYVLLTVSDTGVGIDAATRARIFEPFFTTKEPGRGTGMGLATVYGIVRQSGGFIYVYSEPGRGTTFRIYLPRVQGELTAPIATAAPTRTPSFGTETILLVEDDPAVRAFARRVLEEHGYAVLEAANGADALALAAAHPQPIALLVTDAIMPGLQGHQLAELLSASRPELRTLFMSGFAENSVIHHGALDQGVAFLPKPFGADALCGAVRLALDEQAG